MAAKAICNKSTSRKSNPNQQKTSSLHIEESWIIVGSSKSTGIKVSWNGIPKIKINNSTVC